jgi:hypothetical protein
LAKREDKESEQVAENGEFLHMFWKYVYNAVIPGKYGTISL